MAPPFGLSYFSDGTFEAAVDVGAALREGRAFVFVWAASTAEGGRSAGTRPDSVLRARSSAKFIHHVEASWRDSAYA